MSPVMLRGDIESKLSARVRRNVERLRRVGWTQYAFEKRRRIRYVWRRLLRDSSRHDAKWAPLVGSHEGERVFLIGNGPSLNRTPLYLLRDEYKMCFNRFHLILERLNWEIDFYVVVDNLVLNDMLAELDHVSRVTKHLFLPDIHIRGEEYHKQVKEYDNLYWVRHYGGGIGFSTEAPRVFGGGSVVYEGIQILRFLGFREIVIVGVDLNFQVHQGVRAVADDPDGIEPVKDDDPNHFDPRYFGKGRRYHQPEQHVIDNIRRRLADVATVMPGLGFRVVNAGYDSSVESFERRDFVEYLGKSAAETAALFEECVVRRTRFRTLGEMQASLGLIDVDAARKATGDFAVNVDGGAALVRQRILTHLPLGPFEGRLYFVARGA